MKIQAYDPEAGENVREILKDNSLVEVFDRQYQVLAGADCLAVVTEWNQFRNPDFERIGKELAEAVMLLPTKTREKFTFFQAKQQAQVPL